MSSLLQMLFVTATPFLKHPELASVMAAFFVVLSGVSWLRSHKFKCGQQILLLITAVSWVLFGMNEFIAKAQGWDIRVDLLVTWPALCILTIASLWAGWLRRERATPQNQLLPAVDQSFGTPGSEVCLASRRHINLFLPRKCYSRP